jgi:hypothetical protein
VTIRARDRVHGHGGRELTRAVLREQFVMLWADELQVLCH